MLHSRVGGGVIVGLVFLAGAGAAAQGQKALENRVSALEQRMATAEGQLAAQALQLNTVFTQLGELGQRTTALEAGLAALRNQVGSLTGRTTAVEQFIWPHWINVDCSAGQTIDSALQQTPFSHLGIMTIRISGICTENVSVYRGQTVIEGQGPGAEIVWPSGNVVVVSDIRGGAPRSLALRNLTIRGGGSGVGVKADFGANVYLSNVTILANHTAVSVSNRSMVRIEASSIESNFFGVVAKDGAHVVIDGTQLRNNGDYALSLENGTTASVSGSFITGNLGGGPGQIRGAVGLYNGSTLRINSTEVTGNEGNGIFGGMGSVIWLEDGVKINSNGGHGIAMLDTGVVGKFYVITNISIADNGGHGISCGPSPGVAQLYGFPPAGHPLPDASVAGNRLGAYNCPASPNPEWQF